MYAAMMTATKVRLRFAKHGDLRLISHHDLMRCLERLLRRAQIPRRRAGDSTPAPRWSSPWPWHWGSKGDARWSNWSWPSSMEPDEVLRRLRATTPQGLEWLDVEGVPPGRAAQPASVTYLLEIPRAVGTRPRTGWPPFWAAKNGRIPGTVPIAPWTSISVRSCLKPSSTRLGLLRFRMKMLPSGSARPEEIIDALGLRDLLGEGSVLIRSEVELVP